jgi:type I restriction enzyme, S subunit
MSASKWKPYHENKKSGITWSPEIPVEWKINRVGDVVELINGYPFDSSLFSLGQGIRLIRIRDLTNTGEFTFYSGPEVKEAVVNTGDLLIGMDGDFNTARWNGGKSLLNQRVCCLRSNRSGITTFLSHLLQFPLKIINQTKFSTTVKHLSSNEIKKIKFGLPRNNEELDSIIKFVNKVDNNLSESIANLRRQILLLEEKRSGLITQAVTKGLNADVPMKDSGIEWIREVPEHWNTKKVKHLFQLMNEPSNVSHGMELLSVYTAIGVRPRKSLEQKGNKATSTDGYWIVQKEDLVVNKLLAWMGAIGRSEYDGVTSPAYDILRPLKDTVTEYFHFLFRCGICQPEFKKRSRGIMEMRLRLYFEELGSIEVPCPPPDEQKEIADYIRNLDDTQIDLETAINKQIEMLTEFRTALISAAVTGKIDVRGQA